MGLVRPSRLIAGNVAANVMTGENRPDRNLPWNYYRQVEGLSSPCGCTELDDHELGSRVRKSTSCSMPIFLLNVADIASVGSQPSSCTVLR
jgi:hypothetical protein